MNQRYAILILPCALSTLAFGQGFAELDINDVRARVYSNGLIGPDLSAGSSAFVVPATGGVSPLYSSGLWFGGLSSAGQLHMAAHLYGNSGEHDFFPGPLTTDGSASITAQVSAQFDQVWKINRSEVELHRAYFDCLADPGCDVAVSFPNGYTVPQAFLTWPAIGDVSAGQDLYLAPFHDSDEDGNYDPLAGDHPCVLGDQALFTIFNDRLGPNTQSGGLSTGMEIRMMPFAYTSNPALAQTVFVLYKIINQGTLTLTDFRMGHLADFDLGCGEDDVIGTDVARSMVYAANGDAEDQSCLGTPGYGVQPPAFGMVVLKGPMLDHDELDNAQTLDELYVNGTGYADGIVDNERFGLSNSMYFLRQGPNAMTDPAFTAHYPQLLRSRWKDGVPLTYGGSGYSIDPTATPSLFAFPGETDPMGLGTGGVPQTPWSAILDGSGAMVDPRAVAGMGPFTLEPGAHINLLLAYVHARAGSGGPLASVTALQQRVDSVRAFAQAIPGMMDSMAEDWPWTSCGGITTGLFEFTGGTAGLLVYPNPASDWINVQQRGSNQLSMIRIYNTHGVEVLTHRSNLSAPVIGIGHLAKGLYLVRNETGSQVATARFIKE